ncbi:hypothetical protein [Mycobacterium sp. shizuoka-1]|uniref:hypothetical protein n=1 Tax=Mycobacterium sp. shizuoka-1 TaxID=2039281 RepID=UPI0018EAF671|nr:hypothetical protein [Mycobacterium sp. shizuoka-1]
MTPDPVDTAVVVIDPPHEVTVVRDATAGPRHPSRGDGYQAALVNFAYLAHAVRYTDEVIADMTVPTRGQQ